MINHDRLFKELITTFFLEFIQLFFPQVAAYLEPEPLEFLDKEVFTDITAGDTYETDIVVKAKFQGQDTFFLIHIENQAYYQEHFEQRMFRYFARLSEKYGLPVYPIALLSFDSPQTPQSNSYQVVFPGEVILQFNYQIIQLNRLNWRDFLQQQNPVATALMAKMKMDKTERRQVKLECLRLLATLRLDRARMRLISGFIDTYLRLNATEQELFRAEIATIEPSEQEEVMQIVTSWMEEGIQQEALNFILRLLSRRFGAVTPELQEQIRQLSVIQLEDLGEALLDFSEPADLETWLLRLSNESKE